MMCQLALVQIWGHDKICRDGDVAIQLRRASTSFNQLSQSFLYMEVHSHPLIFAKIYDTNPNISE